MEDFIKVSDKARERINQLLIESNMDKSSHFLRVGVKGGGCSGLSYELDLMTLLLKVIVSLKITE